MTKEKAFRRAVRARGYEVNLGYTNICLTCGRDFDSDLPTRLFGCGHCSAKYDISLRDRITVGTHVLNLVTRVPGRVTNIDKDKYTVAPDDERRNSMDVDKICICPIMDIEVDHKKCRHNKRGPKKGFIPACIQKEKILVDNVV